MTNLKFIVGRLRYLSEQADAGPWTYIHKTYGYAMADEHVVEASNDGGRFDVRYYHRPEHNSMLIAETRNHLDLLLTALEKAVRGLAKIEMIGDQAIDPYEMYANDVQISRKTLNEIEELFETLPYPGIPKRDLV